MGARRYKNEWKKAGSEEERDTVERMEGCWRCVDIQDGFNDLPLLLPTYQMNEENEETKSKL